MFESIVVVGLVVQVLTLVIFCFFLFHLMQQQGRILLRLDALERGESHAQEDSVLTGLAAGTAIQDFQLADLDAKQVALSEFRGRQVLLIYWSASCGFCDMLAPDLAALKQQLEKNNTQLLLVAYGDAESNRKLAVEHGLYCPILPFEGSPAQGFFENEVFQYCGTPSAYLLDEEGRVAEPLATGLDDVLILARKAAERSESKEESKKRSLSKSRIEREGLKAGIPAPDFSLPAVDGETVSLQQYRGRNVLLVFTDPHCGPCDELAPLLVRLHRKHKNNGMALVMVGRGDVEENKKKVMEHKIAFPFVLQDRWKLSKQYGIFATPVAFLIGKDGVIARNVAMGPDQIMTLAREGLASN